MYISDVNKQKSGLSGNIPEGENANIANSHQLTQISKIKKWNFLGKLTKREEVAKGSWLFTIELSEKFDCVAGQYIWLVIPPLSKKVGVKDREAFSIVSFSEESNSVSLLFRDGTSQFKNALTALKAKDEVGILGPFGSSFCIPENFKAPLILIAGGVGVAPFISLGNRVKSEQLDTPLTFIVFNKDKESAVFLDRIQQFQEDCNNCQVISKFDQPKTEDFGPIISDDKNALYYISGTQAFVDSVYTILNGLKVPTEKMRFENYYPSHPTTASLQKLFSLENYQGGLSGSNSELDLRNILKLAIESTSNHILITDVNAQIIFANKAAERITGYSIQEMLGNTPRLWGGLWGQIFIKFYGKAN